MRWLELCWQLLPAALFALGQVHTRSLYDIAPTAQYELNAGQVLSASLLFTAYSVKVDNPTPQWIHILNTLQFIPPQVTGYVVPIPSLDVAAAQFEAPPGVAQPSSTPNQQAVLTYYSYDLPPSGATLSVTVSASPVGTPDWLSVKAAKYLAKGDGVTDDTAAVQQALNDAGSLLPVYFPAGIYSVTGLTMPAGCHLIGDGMGISVIQARGATVNKLVDVLGAPDWAIDEMTIDGNSAHTNTNYGLYLEDLATRGRPRNLEIKGCKGNPGIGLANTDRCFELNYYHPWIHDNLIGIQLVKRCQASVFDVPFIYANTTGQVSLGDGTQAVGPITFRGGFVQQVSPPAAAYNFLLNSVSPLILEGVYMESQSFAASVDLHFTSSAAATCRAVLLGTYSNGNTVATNSVLIDAGVIAQIAMVGTEHSGFAGNILQDNSNASQYIRIAALENTTFIPFQVDGGANFGAGTPLTKDAVFAPSLTPASVAAASVSRQTFTVTGLATTDKVYVDPPSSAVNAALVAARVSAANTLELTFVNPTAGAVTPASGVHNVVAVRS